MARAIWKGEISFGLVSIPVSLVSQKNRVTQNFTSYENSDITSSGCTVRNDNLSFLEQSLDLT
ncbi:hypothetical protein OQJ05_08870 [Fluoribacter gormanii]|uniref:hypothetical protein n=1 Tax=Fluoribacter gormanii TaxID=464 RepID=UPI002244247F|nr:hypothetical protein [Fluoribacter gormanii]MCW8444163.1 hypothetical protein [Fluoribacter gormanii]